MINSKTDRSLAEIICNLFVFLFLYTAISKYHEFHSFRNILAKSPLIGNFSFVIAWLLPAVELLTAVLLLITRTRSLGLYFSFFLMSLFTVYIGYMIAFTPHLPCSCGGVIRKMSWQGHLFFNLCLTVLGAVGISLEKKQNKLTVIQKRSILVS